MSTRQTAVINGLLVENLGKNDLVRSAEARSRDAEYTADRAKHEADIAQIRLTKARKEIAQLQQQLTAEQQEKEAYKRLLSRPLQEIAAVNGDFKKTYEQQQQLLAEWIMGQKAYKETAMQLGLQVGKNPEEVQNIASGNYTAVLENRTEHGNNADTNPLLVQHASAILEIRKRQGKA